MRSISLLKRPQRSYYALVSFVTLSTGFSIVFLYTRDPSTLGVPYDEFNCGCPRFGRPISKEEQEEGSLCGLWSTVRGPGQNVLSYTVFESPFKGAFRQYYGQIEDRIREADIYYPGWTVRLYHNTSKTNDGKVNNLLCNLYCKYPHFDLCDVNQIFIPPSWNMSEAKILESKSHREGLRELFISFLHHMQKSLNPTSTEEVQNKDAINRLEQERTEQPKQIQNLEPTKLNFSSLLVGKMWRFAAMADPYVNLFLVRDVDSYILPREVAAVEDWISNSSAPTHSIRDHPSHNGYILAGLWGGSRKTGGDMLRGLFQKILNLPLDYSDLYDQTILGNIVWGEVQDKMLIHDSYHCKNPILSRKNIPRPFPTRRRGKMFVSWGPFRTPNELTLITPCPKACRPEGHKDWIHC